MSRESREQVPEFFDAPPEEDVFDLFPRPDAIGLVLEAAALQTVYLAEVLTRVSWLRDEALARERASDRGVSVSIVDRSVRLELAAALRVTEHRAGQLLALADAVAHDYPAVLSALHRASITEDHARILVDTLASVEPEFRDGLLQRGLELAEAEPVGTFRRTLKRLADLVRAETLAERHREAVKERRLCVEAGIDGMGWLSLHAPLVELRAIENRITAMAGVIRKRGAEERSLDQVRADVACDLLVDGMTESIPTDARGIRATVMVTVPALALLEADASAGAAADAGAAAGGAGGDVDRARMRGARREPGSNDRRDDARPDAVPNVEGIGPIPIGTARELAGGDGDWMRVLTHPETGMVLSVGRDRYRPPAALRNLVKWRSERCMAPGCAMPAGRCQLDHNVDYALGGETSLTNLAPFCQGHHTVKHHGGWRVRQIPGTGGAIEWTSPTGRVYTVRPERRVPFFTPAAHVRDSAPPGDGPPPF